MQFKSEKKPLVILLGPTASGKTEAAISIAKQVSGEIISGDSRLFYRGMDIGTAKPTPEQLSSVPHHLVDIAEPDQPFSLAVFQTYCKKIIREIHERNHIPIIVGGTGQYIHAITEAWDIPQQEADAGIRTILEKIGREGGQEVLYQQLSVLDPEAAVHIDRRNLRRVIRALEVIYLTGRKFSTQRKKGEIEYKVIQIGIHWSRDALYQRIDMRIDNMMNAGLVNEVRQLLEEGYTGALPAMSAIGYNEIADYLNGKCTMDEAIMLIKRKTRQFVRRQANWFKLSDPRIKWFIPDPEMISLMVAYIQEKISDNE